MRIPMFGMKAQEPNINKFQVLTQRGELAC